MTRATSSEPASSAGAPPSLRLRDVSAIGWDAAPSESLGVLGWAPCWMTVAERLMLYSLVFSLQPRRYLEIGTFKGGSALIVSAAMDASRNQGWMVCVDPDPQVDPEHWKLVHHRATLLRGASPDVLEEAQRILGGPFDFVLIDGDHTREGVARDVGAMVDRIERGGHLLCHDGFHPDVAEALDEFADAHRDRIADLGMLTRDVTYAGEGVERTGPWGGLRLFRFA